MRIPRREDEMFNLDREGLRMCITSFATVFSFVETVTCKINGRFLALAAVVFG